MKTLCSSKEKKKENLSSLGGIGDPTSMSENSGFVLRPISSKGETPIEPALPLHPHPQAGVGTRSSTLPWVNLHQTDRLGLEFGLNLH
jgi:hypothetical protein